MSQYIFQRGALLGGFHIVLTLVLYLLGPEYLVSFTASLIVIIGALSMLTYFGVSFRKLNNGFLTFKDAFVFLFFVMLVSAILRTIFIILLYHVIDPELPRTVKDATIQKTISMMERFNAPQEDIDEQIEKLQDQPDQNSITGILSGLFIILIIDAIVALILAAILKKEPPVFENNLNTESP